MSYSSSPEGNESGGAGHLESFFTERALRISSRHLDHENEQKRQAFAVISKEISPVIPCKTGLLLCDGLATGKTVGGREAERVDRKRDMIPVRTTPIFQLAWFRPGCARVLISSTTAHYGNRLR